MLAAALLHRQGYHAWSSLPSPLHALQACSRVGGLDAPPCPASLPHIFLDHARERGRKDAGRLVFGRLPNSAALQSDMQGPLYL